MQVLKTTFWEWKPGNDQCSTFYTQTRILPLLFYLVKLACHTTVKEIRHKACPLADEDVILALRVSRVLIKGNERRPWSQTRLQAEIKSSTI